MLVFPIEVHVVGGERNTVSVIYANAFIWVHMVRSGAMVSCAHTLTRYTWFLNRGRRGSFCVAFILSFSYNLQCCWWARCHHVFIFFSPILCGYYVLLLSLRLGGDIASYVHIFNPVVGCWGIRCVYASYIFPHSGTCRRRAGSHVLIFSLIPPVPTNCILCFF